MIKTFLTTKYTPVYVTLGFLALLILETAFLLQVSLSFFSPWEEIATFISVFFATVLLVMAVRSNQSKMPRHLVAGCLALSLISPQLVPPIQRRQRSITKQRARLLVTHLQAYQKREGRFPERLQQLQPDYLEAVPEASMGFYAQPLLYYPKDGHFRLEYLSFNGFIEGYSTLNDLWYGYD